MTVTATPVNELVFPVVHLNGTAQSRLIEDYCEVRGAVLKALEKLQELGPNQRDYYCHSNPLGWQLSQQQHWARIAALRAIEQEIGTIMDNIDAQPSQPGRS